MTKPSDDFVATKELLKGYKPSSETIELLRTTPIVLLVGISGAGKDTIKSELIKTGNYQHIVSHTTRPPRVNNGKPEVDGEDYHFVNFAKVRQMLESGDFIEAKPYSGNIYGTTTADIEAAKASGKVALTTLEVQGVAEYLERSETVKPIFVLPPSIDVWRERTLGRGETNALEQRLQTAPGELRAALDEPRYAFVINNDLEEAVAYTREVAELGQIDPVKQQAGRELAELLLAETTSLLEQISQT